MRLRGSIIAVWIQAGLVACLADDYLATVGPAPLQYASPPPPLSRQAWRLPLVPVNVEVAAEKKTNDVSAAMASTSSRAAPTNVPATETSPPAVQTNALAGAVSSQAKASDTADESDTIRSQSKPPMILPVGPVGPGGPGGPIPPMGVGGPPTTAFALMQYFKSGNEKKGATDVIVPVPVGFVPPMPMPMPAKPSSSATYLSP